MQVAFYLAGEITQVIDSIPWVRCASGNVCFKTSQTFLLVSTFLDMMFEQGADFILQILPLLSLWKPIFGPFFVQKSAFFYATLI